MYLPYIKIFKYVIFVVRLTLILCYIWVLLNKDSVILIMTSVLKVLYILIHNYNYHFLFLFNTLHSISINMWCVRIKIFVSKNMVVDVVGLFAG